MDLRPPILKLLEREKSYHLQEYYKSQIIWKAQSISLTLFSVGQYSDSKTSWPLLCLVTGIICPLMESQFISSPHPPEQLLGKRWGVRADMGKGSSFLALQDSIGVEVKHTPNIPAPGFGRESGRRYRYAAGNAVSHRILHWFTFEFQKSSF